MRIDSSGRLGLGTTSPLSDAKLTIGDNDAPAIAFQRTGSGKFESAIGMIGNSALRFYVGADSGSITGLNEAMQIDSLGRLLVGTTTEGAAFADNLTVVDSGHSGLTIRSGTANLGSLYFSDGTSGAAEYAGFVEYNHNGNYLGFGTGSTTRMRIDSSGNVGIGTTSPSSKLQVNGTVTATAFSGDGSALTNLPAAGVSLGLVIALG